MAGTNFFTVAPFNASVRIALTDQNGDVVLGSFTGSVPTNANVFAKGCLLLKSDAATGVQAVYENVGTVASPSFVLIGGGPAFSVQFADQYTTTGGAAAEAITVTGALSTDLAFVQLVDPGTNTVTVSIAVVTADTLTVTFSADPGNDAIINYQIIRATV